MKKYIHAILALFITINSNYISILAEESYNEDFDEERMNCQISEEMEAYIETEEYQTWLQSFKNYAEELSNSVSVARTGGTKTLNITGYEQETNYYCAPASVQIVIKYLTGIKYSQSNLATQLGTNATTGTIVANVPPVINSYVGSGTYNYVSTSSVALSTGVIASLEADYPVIANVISGYLPGYSSTSKSGHYIVIYGYKAGWYSSTYVSQVTYFDPFSNESGAYGSHTITFDEMKNAVNANSGFYIVGS